MANGDGTPIWYELLSPDPAAARAFYGAVIGWGIDAESVGSESGAGDYRMISTGDGNVGGVMRLTDEMIATGARPRWLFYLNVADVDAKAAEIAAAGGAVLISPWTIPNVGRIALAADPQGVPFYILRPDGTGESTVFDRAGMGKCSWNELVTSDQPSANAFYARLFGWTYPDRMVMPGDRGDYVFVHAADREIGATMPCPGTAQMPGWRFYFRVPDLDASAAAVRAGGGTVVMGSQDIPGGDRILHANDPHDVPFGLVASGMAA